MSRSLIALLLVAAPVFADVTARTLPYKHGDVSLKGVLVLDAEAKGKRPGVLFAHEQGPDSALAKSKAALFARLGYVVLAIDLDGTAGKDRTLVRERVAAGRAALDKVPQVDPKRVAAVGYGSGGTAVLEYARAKADVEGVACVHGDLAPAGDEGKNVGASILVIVGADDPNGTKAKCAAFEEEMEKGGVDWQLLRFGGVAGDFSNPQAGKSIKTGKAYDPDADLRAFDAVRLFLAEMFRPAPKPVVPVKKPAVGGIPDKVHKMLDIVDRDGEAPDGYEGGRPFGNFERRLPQTDGQGRRIKYREWDVNPLRAGVNRGAERLVTGSDGSAHYTSDHYATFKKIR